MHLQVGMGAELDGETVNDGRRNGAAGPCNNTISNLSWFWSSDAAFRLSQAPKTFVVGSLRN